MARTNKKVRYLPESKHPEKWPKLAAETVESALRVIEGRWKMIIIFHLFAEETLRFSELERAIAGVTQKMLIQQLRELERDHVVLRVVHPVVPPKVEYSLTELGKALCPMLDKLLEWAMLRAKTVGGDEDGRLVAELATRTELSTRDCAALRLDEPFKVVP